jgi:hypothetical protein
VGKTKRGKGTKLMAIADATGLPLAVHTDSASPHEVTHVQATIDKPSLGDCPSDLSGIVPMTVIRSMKSLPQAALR